MFNRPLIVIIGWHIGPMAELQIMLLKGLQVRIKLICVNYHSSIYANSFLKEELYNTYQYVFRAMI